MPRASPGITDPEVLQQELGALRKQLHLSQDVFAARLGVTKNTVSLWERGEVTPSLTALYLARWLAKEAPPPERVTLYRHRRYRAKKFRILWDVAFVLVRLFPSETISWVPTDDSPCSGQRVHMVALLPPTPRTRKRVETVACEAHLWHGLYVLQQRYEQQMKQHTRWRQPRKHRAWWHRWVDAVALWHEWNKEAMPDE